MNVTDEGIQLILDYEVGGGKAYYNKRLRNPEWPEGESGVTIGVGFDLGYVNQAEFRDAWFKKLNPADFHSLSSVLGKTGERASKALASVFDIEIPWETALQVFKEYTLPTHWLRAMRIYPQMETISPLCAAPLLSLCFNRGTKLTGDRRTEMLAIQTMLKDGNLRAIPEEFRKMKRLWPDVKGLRDRRDAEADMFERGLD